MGTKGNAIIAQTTPGREFLVQQIAEGCYDVRCPHCDGCGTFDAAGAWPISMATFLDAHQGRCAG